MKNIFHVLPHILSSFLPLSLLLSSNPAFKRDNLDKDTSVYLIPMEQFSRYNGTQRSNCFRIVSTISEFLLSEMMLLILILT